MRRLGIFVILISLIATGCQGWQHSQTVSAAGRDSSRARELNDRAFRLITEGDYERATKLLREAVAADTMFGPARNNLGLCYYHTNHLYEAAWEFENAVRLMPYQPEPRNNLGLVLEKAGKLTNAADAYAKAREMEPDNPEFLSNLARAKIRRGDRDQDTRTLLEEVVLKDSRPDWNDWARMNLFRLKGLAQDAATTQP